MPDLDLVRVPIFDPQATLLDELCEPVHLWAARRFLAKVRFSADCECWEWAGCRQNSAKRFHGREVDWRGRFHFGTSTQYAHRVAWQLWRGPLSPADVVMHDCDNSLCVNPWHLLLGNQAENLADMRAKGRARKAA